MRGEYKKPPLGGEIWQRRCCAVDKKRFAYCVTLAMYERYTVVQLDGSGFSSLTEPAGSNVQHDAWDNS